MLPLASSGGFAFGVEVRLIVFCCLQCDWSSVIRAYSFQIMSGISRYTRLRASNAGAVKDRIDDMYELRLPKIISLGSSVAQRVKFIYSINRGVWQQACIKEPRKRESENNYAYL